MQVTTLLGEGDDWVTLHGRQLAVLHHCMNSNLADDTANAALRVIPRHDCCHGQHGQHNQQRSASGPLTYEAFPAAQQPCMQATSKLQHLPDMTDHSQVARTMDCIPAVPEAGLSSLQDICRSSLKTVEGPASGRSRGTKLKLKTLKVSKPTPDDTSSLLKACLGFGCAAG